MDKQETMAAYQGLVRARKACGLCCSDLINPSSIPDLDSDEIGPLSLWQNSLEADILVVAQDWGDLNYFKSNGGHDNPIEITSRNLEEFLKVARLDPGPVLGGLKNPRLFFTNAVLCLKKDSKAGALKAAHIFNCREAFLSKTIQMLPKLRHIITLGRVARDSVIKSLNGPSLGSMKDSVGRMDLNYGSYQVYSLFHPGSLGIRNRSKDLQTEDWKLVGRTIHETS